MRFWPYWRSPGWQGDGYEPRAAPTYGRLRTHAGEVRANADRRLVHEDGRAAPGSAAASADGRAYQFGVPGTGHVADHDGRQDWSAPHPAAVIRRRRRPPDPHRIELRQDVAPGVVPEPDGQP